MAGVVAPGRRREAPPRSVARVLGPLVVSAASALLPAGAALAQGYDVATADGRFEAAPDAAATLDVSTAAAGRTSAQVRLPFEFWYYGTPCRDVLVSAHGFAIPGTTSAPSAPDDPDAPHGQDAATSAFPYDASGDANGVVAAWWTRLSSVSDGSPTSGRVRTWTAGEAPLRRFVVAWDSVAGPDGARRSFQIQFHETTFAIVIARAPQPATTPSEGDAAPTRYVCGLDAPGDSRFAAGVGSTGRATGWLPTDLVFTPRTALYDAPGSPERTVRPRWEDVPRESLRGEDGATSASYVGVGTAWYRVADRVVRSDPARRKALAAEDLRTFAPRDGRRTPGDPARWVRHVLDGRMTLVPAGGGPPVRVWLRVVEFFTLDDRGLAGRDDHVWNLRILLRMAFPDGDPRGKIENYVAWRASARARLCVGKLFDARQTDDSAKQFDTGRVGESVNWCARLRPGARGSVPDHGAPGDGWVRFPMRSEDETIVQHADRGGVRFVADPNYVESGYRYVVLSEDGTGWVARRRSAVPASDDADDFEDGR